MILRKLVKENVRKCLIKSSNISGTEYHLETHTLLVTFNNGGQYEYYNVTEQDYIRLEGADSQGKILNSVIKKNYKFNKVDSPQPLDEDLFKAPEEKKVINEEKKDDEEK